jgi:hypothetical protein
MRMVGKKREIGRIESGTITIVAVLDFSRSVAPEGGRGYDIASSGILAPHGDVGRDQ